ncbi:synaptotagmin-1-like [Dendronephthya gigantea]|uniref:synaptotagmin-1-like n=1 Tax=Dendronephthya gigantea TaxID=151771 RepID=UPI00106DCF8A|nr:synaptotagmin-1-like [Dendronephthya gigantea]
MRIRNVMIPVERKQDGKLCLSIQLKPDKFIWEAQTKIVQGTENPIFGEMFTISGFSLSKLHDCALLFRLNDFNVDQTIGEVTYSLRDLQPDVFTSRTSQLQQPLGVPKEKDRSYVGDLLVSMDYDPIDWKLNVKIIRARGLPKMTRVGHTDAFVKINVMQDLNRIFKRKTKVQHHEWNPEFDEGFDFELTRDQMQSTSITMKVIHRGKLRDHLIGVVLVGFNVDPTETGYQHWNMMMDKPNLSIEQWHKIYPVLK